MSTTRQIVYSLILLTLALGGVGLYRAWAAPADPGGMEGHNHAAMGGGGDGDVLNPVQLSERESRAIGVTFATVERTMLERSVRTVGNVRYDETRRALVNPKIDGWVEALHVDFTGAPVRRGQPLLDIYSPALVTAQEELILARRMADRAQGERASKNAQDLLEAARRRLAYWDIPDAEIQRIEESGDPSRALTLRAPTGGVVVTKNVVEGGRITPGTDLFEIADLSTVWVEGEVFEKDLSLVTVGQPARVTFEAYPGQIFEGEITYVYPTVSVESRTGRIRVELANPDLRLRPGMFADINISVRTDDPVLVVPRTAVLSTGERDVVFMRHDDGTLMPHEVTLGLTAGDRVEILDGIGEGARVVSSAGFLIDAESNLGASMGAMAGMDHGDMSQDPMSQEPMSHDTMDHGTMDHSGHDMGGEEPMSHDTVDHSTMDHSGQDDMSGMEPTSQEPMSHDSGDHSTMDHSGHELTPDTAGSGGTLHHNR